jgi:teichuronic acid biosynthesis glycosyltransferase TuaC
MYPSPVHPTYGRFIHEHVRALQDRNVEIKVIAPTPWTPPGLGRLKQKWADYAKIAGGQDRVEGVPVMRPAYLALPGPLDFVRALSMAASLRRCWKRLLRDFDCDLIHAHALTPDGYAACKLGRAFGRPVVCSARGSELHQRPRESRTIRNMTRWLLRNCDAAVAVSRSLAQEAVDLAGGEFKPEVVYNGVADAFQAPADRRQIRRELNLPEPARIIVFTGRCEKDKGVEELVEAFGMITTEEASAALLFVGDGGARNELETRARREPWGSRVWFAGQVGREKVRLYLQAADVFVLPSHGEGMPNSLLEAMAVGLPCVATRVGGAPEAIEDNRNGLLIPAKSAGAIAAALRKVLHAPGFAEQLGTAATRTIRERFSWSANAERHLAIYEEVIRNFHNHANNK